jgi:hypothetical protein
MAASIFSSFIGLLGNIFSSRSHLCIWEGADKRLPSLFDWLSSPGTLKECSGEGKFFHCEPIERFNKQVYCKRWFIQ